MKPPIEKAIAVLVSEYLRMEYEEIIHVAGGEDPADRDELIADAEAYKRVANDIASRFSKTHLYSDVREDIEERARAVAEIRAENMIAREREAREEKARDYFQMEQAK